jgi:DNA-binding NtrC family response regulator
MPTHVIIAERTGRWAPLLRVALGDAGSRMHESGTIEAAWRMLDTAPASFLALELTERNAPGLIPRVFNLARTHPRARVAILADRAISGYAELMLEAGAVAFTSNPRRLAPLAEVARRHLAAAPAEPPPYPPIASGPHCPGECRVPLDP